MTSRTETDPVRLNVGIFRRLFAIAYDGFLLIALLFITTALFTAFNQGNAIEPGNVLYIPFVVTLFLLTYFFFAWFWTHGGQTLGLKTWRCRVVSEDEKPVSWKQATIRFFVAILSIAAFGIGFIWSLFHQERKTWHDIASKTKIVDLR